VEAQGSYAKGTLLSDKWEIDVFAIIDADRGWIQGEAPSILLDCLHGLPLVTKYSQHPYVTVSLMGMEADIVPVRMARDPKEARGVERTPFHTRWVRERITEVLADEVRLLKSFLKGVGVYGAETARGGFSGYLAEVLTITYGGFIEVLREASAWRPPIRLDPEGHGDWGILEEKYRGDPLIVVDPVDPGRNLASAVTIKSLSTFILAARNFLEAPGNWYFHVYRREPSQPPEGVSGVGLALWGRYYLYPPQDVEGRLARLSRALEDRLAEWGFRSLYSGFSWDGSERAVVYVVLEALELPSIEVLQGPEVWSSWERVYRFISKRIGEGGGAWIRGDRLAGYRRRRYVLAEDLIASILHTLPLPRGTVRVEVLKCPGEGCRGWHGREVLHGLDPTPAWIRRAFGVERQQC